MSLDIAEPCFRFSLVLGVPTVSIPVVRRCTLHVLIWVKDVYVDPCCAECESKRNSRTDSIPYEVAVDKAVHMMETKAAGILKPLVLFPS